MRRRRILVFLGAGGALVLAVVVGLVVWFGYRYGSDEVLDYATVGDTVLQAYVFEPVGARPSSGWPAALIFHGGGWRHGHPAQMFHLADYLAEHGFVAVSVSYRLANGGGRTPYDCVEDARTAYRWLSEQAADLGVDRTRIVVGGGSAGGHLAAVLGVLPSTDASQRPPAAMLLMNPAVDTSFEELSTATLRELAPSFSGRGRSVSPTHHVRAGLPPALVFHGEQDGIVPFEHARVFCDRMREAGNVCDLVAYPDAGHGFYNVGLSRVEDVHRKIREFLAEHLQAAL